MSIDIGLVIKWMLYGLLGSLLAQAGVGANSLIFWSIIVTVLSIEYVGKNY